MRGCTSYWCELPTKFYFIYLKNRSEVDHVHQVKLHLQTFIDGSTQLFLSIFWIWTYYHISALVYSNSCHNPFFSVRRNVVLSFHGWYFRCVIRLNFCIISETAEGDELPRLVDYHASGLFDRFPETKKNNVNIIVWIASTHIF